MNLIITLCGFWVALDGIISIRLYRYQTLKEHIFRFIRSIIGSIITLFGLVL